jgi:hypothetical protein
MISQPKNNINHKQLPQMLAMHTYANQSECTLKAPKIFCQLEIIIGVTDREAHMTIHRT